MKIISLLAQFRPSPFQVSGPEKLRAIIGAGVGVLVSVFLMRLLAGLHESAGHVWLFAPLGASALLIFVMPSSPVAQPWTVVVGNTSSVLIGALCGMVVHDPVWAAGLAVALAIMTMFALRCLHPPGGAAALLSATGGVGLHYAIFPTLPACLILVAAGILYNTLTGRRYPHVPVAAAPGASGSQRFTSADFDAALTHYNRVLDVNPDDLQALLHHAEAAAYQRRFGDLRCRDVMSTTLAKAEFGTPLQAAWTLMQQRRIKALPVVDRGNHVVGIVTVADFMRHAGLHQPSGIGHRIKRLVTPTGTTHSDKPEVVGQIMTAPVTVAQADRHLAELVPLFSQGGHHHIPVVDERHKAVGIITQTDLVRALYSAAAP